MNEKSVGKKLLSVFLTVAMTLTVIGSTVFANGTTDGLTGSGTQISPYEIDSETDLLAFAEIIKTDTEAYAKLTADVTMTQTFTTAVMAVDKAYEGTFDGDNHAIVNLSIKGGANLALFGKTSGATIKNLGLKNVNINGWDNYCAAFVSRPISTAIEKCYAEGTVKGGGGTGGFTGNSGETSNHTTVKNSYFAGTITGEGTISGIGQSAIAEYCIVAGLVESTTENVVKTTNIRDVNNNNTNYIENAKAKGHVVGYGNVLSEGTALSGELCYKANGGDIQLDSPIFGQTLGTDKHPVFATDSNKVEKNTIGYKNTGDTNASDGTSDKPYVLYSFNDLKEFRDYVNNSSDTNATATCAKLGADIDMKSEVWTPIGTGSWDWNTSVKYYTGTFDGDGHCVKNILTNGGDFQGFFRSTNGATIKNFGIESGTIKTNNGGAAIVAAAYNTLIEKCYNKADVEATGVRAGGFVGFLNTRATGFPGVPTIINCYNLGDVSGKGGEMSGISIRGTIENCYFAGTITINDTATAKYEIGNGTVKNSYTLSKTNGYGTKATADQFASGEIAFTLGEAFGQTLSEDKYPVFRTADNQVYDYAVGYSNTSDLDGNENKPFEIRTMSDLLEFKTCVNSGNSYSVKLCDNIDISSATNWSPIGTLDNMYTKVFDGNGKEIAGLTITSGCNVGLFAKTNGATVKNLKLTNVSVSGGNNVGSIAGLSNGSKFENCVVTGTVNASSGAGSGLIGWSNGVNNVYTADEIVGCVFNGTLTTIGAANGIAADGKIKNTYVIGNIEGGGTVSGISLNADISNCYVSGEIKSTEGSAMRLGNGPWSNAALKYKITNSYYTSVSASNDSIGGAGTKIDSADVASGKLAYLLNSNAQSMIYGQKLDTDDANAYPVLNGAAVYMTASGDYSNTEGVIASVKQSDSGVKVWAKSVGDANPVGIIGQYNGTVLKEIETVQNITSGGIDKTIKPDVDVTDVCLFIWSDLTNLKPLVQAMDCSVVTEQ